MESLPCAQNLVTSYVWTRVMQVRKDKDLYPYCGALPPKYELDL